jgi:hypothetical protein
MMTGIIGICLPSEKSQESNLKALSAFERARHIKWVAGVGWLRDEVRMPILRSFRTGDSMVM